MKKKIFFILTATTFLLAACNRNVVKVTSFSPSGEVQEFTTFEITFNKDLAPPDVIDHWEKEDYVTFEPAIPGMSKWTSPSTLIFSPEVPLKPGQDYSAKITKKVSPYKTLMPALPDCNVCGSITSPE